MCFESTCRYGLYLIFNTQEFPFLVFTFTLPEDLLLCGNGKALAASPAVLEAGESSG